MYRYDDRLYIQSNLIDAYDLLMDFVAKHLPDPFYLEGAQRVSLRSKIFREVIANLIVHREYTNAYPCTFVIKNGVLETENANNPHGYGPVDPQKFVPFPKNPTIVNFFIQLGRVEELGSGVLNINRYLKAYSGTGKPEFIEGEVFKVRIPLPDPGKREVVTNDQQDADKVLITIVAALSEGLNDTDDGINDGVKLETAKVIQLILGKEGINARNITKMTSKSKPTIERYLRIARTENLIEFVGPPKTGGYYLTEKMKARLDQT